MQLKFKNKVKIAKLDLMKNIKQSKRFFWLYKKKENQKGRSGAALG